MIKRELSLCIVLALAVFSGDAKALGLGSIEVKSGLGQPLVAEIPLVSASPIELDQLSVRLASPDAFERVGLDRPSGLTANLQFSLGRNSRGQPVIRVTTAQRFNEPMLNFLVEADWGKGAVVREFTALVDPPYVSNVVVKPVQAPAASNPVVIAPAISAPPPDLPTIKLSPKVENPLTVVQTAPSPQIAPAPVREDPPAPTAQAPAPSVVETPAPSPVVADPPPQVQASLPPPPPAPVPVQTTPTPQPQPVTSVPAADSDSERTVGPVKDGQTLWSIAEQARPDDSVSMDQMMLALLQANPEAFDEANVNKLKSGAVLRIPSKTQVQELSPEQATQLIRAQGEDFRTAPAPVPQPVETEVASRPEPKPAPAPTPVVKPAPAQNETAPPSAVPSERAVAQVSAPAARLEIAPPVDRQGGAGRAQSGAASNRGGSELRAQLTDARETLAAREAELKELKSRVTDLENLDDQNQSLIDVQNSKIQALEDQLRQLREQEAALAAKAAQTPPAAAASSPPAAQTAEAPAPEGAAGITQSPWFYPSVLGGAALLLGGLWWLRRRKPAEEAPQRSPKLEQFMRQMPSPAASSAPVASAPAPAPAPAVVAAPEPAPLVPVPAVEDPIARLRSQIESNPKDLDAHLALLREHYERGEKDAFENAARGMRNQVQTTLDARWREAAVMGLSLLPGHPLFSGSGWNAPKFSATPEDNSRADFEMPTSIRPVVRDSTPNEAPSPIASAPADEAPLPGFLQGANEDMADADTEAMDTLAFAETADPDAAAAEINLDSYSDIGLTPPHDSQRTEAEVMQEDEGIGTKIELAKAYLDIGDVDGARSMLLEVIAEAGPKGRAEAERLLQQLG